MPPLRRPANNFMYFRSHYSRILKRQNPGITQKEISKILKKQWHSISPKEYNEWTIKSLEGRIQNRRTDPFYRYDNHLPLSTEDRMLSQPLPRDLSTEGSSCPFIIENVASVEDFERSTKEDWM
ncbi:14247_t:CDS:1, partial [Acaulospora morrowiae]